MGVRAGVEVGLQVLVGEVVTVGVAGAVVRVGVGVSVAGTEVGLGVGVRVSVKLLTPHPTAATQPASMRLAVPPIRVRRAPAFQSRGVGICSRALCISRAVWKR